MVNKKILLADDVELFLELEKTFFHREGFELLVARTGREAYDKAAAERPDHREDLGVAHVSDHAGLRDLVAADDLEHVELHDGGGARSATLAALPAIVKGIRQRGLRLVALAAS